MIKNVLKMIEKLQDKKKKNLMLNICYIKQGYLVPRLNYKFNLSYGLFYRPLLHREKCRCEHFFVEGTE